jgi:hypothetical protein
MQGYQFSKVRGAGTMRDYRSILVVGAAIAALSACSDEFSVSFSTSSISTVAVQGSPSFEGAMVITATGEGPTPAALYVDASIEGNGIVTPIPVLIDPGASLATFTVLPDTSLAVGSHTGTLTLAACKDPSCNAQFSGSPHRISYNIDLVASLVASSSAVKITAPEGTVGAAVPLSLTLPAVATVSYAQSQDWLAVSDDGNSLVLTPDARALLAGTYQATIALHADNPSQTTKIPVTFAVTPAIVVPVSLALTLNGASVPGDMAGSFPVTAVAGATLPSWTAASDVPWLALDQDSGAGAGTVSWHLDVAAVTALENGTSQVAHVTLNAGSHLTPSTISLQLNKQLPEIANLDRVALLPGESGSVMMYGTGLQTIANPVTSLHIAGGHVESVSVLSDRALDAVVTALPAGDYAVTLANGVGIATATRTLSVLEPVARSYQTVETSGLKQTLVWDGVGQSAFTINFALDLVMRFDLSHTPAIVAAKTIPGVRALGLTLDRSVLLVSDGAGNLYDLRPSDLETVRTRSVGVRAEATGLPIPITGDNLAWIVGSGGLAYDLDHSRFASSVDPNSQFGFYDGAVSPNGRRMLVTESPYVFPSPPAAYFDAVEGGLHKFSTSLLSFFYHATTDRKGERWILNNQVYGFDLSLRGSVLVPTGWVGMRYAFSRDGRRAYLFSISENAIGTYSEPDPIGIFPRIFVFDTTGPLITTTDYPLIGSFEVANYASCLATQGPVICSPYTLSFAITDDDRTLLAVGDRRLLVIPIPAQFLSP